MDSENLEYILDHYKNPRNYGRIDTPDASYEQGIPSCGDRIRIDLSIDDSIVKELKFSGTGCAISQASVSILTEKVLGRDIGEIQSMTEEDMLGALKSPISPIRLKCALLGLNVLKQALSELEEPS